MPDLYDPRIAAARAGNPEPSLSTKLMAGALVIVVLVVLIGFLWSLGSGVLASRAKHDLAVNGTQIAGTVMTCGPDTHRGGHSWWGDVSYVAPGGNVSKSAYVCLGDASNPQPAIGSMVTLLYEKDNSQSPDTQADLQQNLGMNSFVINSVAILVFGGVGVLIFMAIMARMNRPVEVNNDDGPYNPAQRTMPPPILPEREDYWNSIDKDQ